MRSEATKERESATDEGKIRESAKSEKPRSGERMAQISRDHQAPKGRKKKLDN